MKASSNTLILAAVLSLAAPATAATLAVDVGSDLKAGDHLAVALHQDEASWLSKVFRASRVPVSEALGQTPRQTLSFADLPPGRCAVAVYVDRNGNGRLDRGMFGIPSEPYGFSNGGGRFGPPDFDAALIDVVDGDTAIRIELN